MSTMKVKILAKSLKKTINEIKSDRNAHQNTGAYLIANSCYACLCPITIILSLHS
jgi:hypothetical protein